MGKDKTRLAESWKLQKWGYKTHGEFITLLSLLLFMFETCNNKS